MWLWWTLPFPSGKRSPLRRESLVKMRLQPLDGCLALMGRRDPCNDHDTRSQPHIGLHQTSPSFFGRAAAYIFRVNIPVSLSVLLIFASAFSSLFAVT